MLKRFLPSPAMAVALVAVVLAAGGFASARSGGGIPAPDGVLHACLTPAGSVRVTPPEEACRAGERSLTLEAPGDPLTTDAPIAFAARSAGTKRVGTRLTRLVSGAVPAGTYYVSGAVRVTHPEGVSEDTRITCALRRPNGNVIAASIVRHTFLKDNDAGEVTLPVSATVDRMPAGRSSLACKQVTLSGGIQRAASRRAQVAQAPSSPGSLSANLVQLPVKVPINVCGTMVKVPDLLKPAFGNTCRNG